MVSARALHHRLLRLNEVRLRPTVDDAFAHARLENEMRDRCLEEAFVTDERAAVREMVADVSSNADGFIRWFEKLRTSGPGQNDPLFPWLAETATLDEMRWFLGQELAGEAGFEDLLALTQVKMPQVAKLEIARNFWDEMGRGRAVGMHGPMLEDLANALAVRLPLEHLVPEPIALANLMVALAWNRHYAFQSLGALGVIELTAPGRSHQVNLGLRRLGVAPGARRYFALHATLDIEHSASWNREVLRALVEDDPRRARPIAEGALMRLRAGQRCFEAYRDHLWENTTSCSRSASFMVE